MYQFDTNEVKNKFKLQLLKSKHGLEQGPLLDFLEDSLNPDDFYLHEQLHLLVHTCLNGSIAYLDIDSNVAEDMLDTFQYYISAIFIVPELFPYRNDEDFIHFMRDEMISLSDDEGNLIDLVYIPVSNITEMDDPIYQDMKEVPAFMLGVSEQGTLAIETYIEFYDSILDFYKAVKSYVEKKEAGGASHVESVVA